MEEQVFDVFVRVPIPRGDFVDPPPVNWDSSKDEALWKILSGAAQTEIDWNQVAERFDVPVDFLLRQVAYLTERHASQVRAQVRKATAAAKGGSSAPSPVLGSESLTGLRSIRRDSPAARNDGSGTGTPINASTRPGMSRNTSASTAVLRDGGSSSPRPGSSSRPGTGVRAGDASGRRRLSSLPIQSTPDDDEETRAANPERQRSSSPGPAEESSTTTDSEDESSPAQSRIIRRPPRLAQRDPPTAYEVDDDGDESEPAFQPYKLPSTKTQTSAQDLTSTLRGDGRSSTSRRGLKGTNKAQHAQKSQLSDSDNSSAPPAHQPGKSRGQTSREQKTPGPLSPRRTAELSGRSPGGKGSREGSEGTPSMGSSFSDLDDASVTQSALEEALASHMNRGSRFSISSAFRSRYGPSGNPSGNPSAS